MFRSNAELCPRREKEKATLELALLRGDLDRIRSVSLYSFCCRDQSKQSTGAYTTRSETVKISLVNVTRFYYE